MAGLKMRRDDGAAYDILCARGYAYAFGQAALGSEPTEAFLEAVDVDLLVSTFDTLGVSGAREVADSFAVASRDGEKLACEYTKLFVGPGKLAAPPWEAVYRTRSRELFQRETLEVRNAYRAQGFLPAEYPRVSDDHIALELGFLAALAVRASDGYAEGDVRGASEALEASRDFLSDHLLVWIESYACDLAKENPESFYAKVVGAMSALARRDRALIEDFAMMGVVPTSAGCLPAPRAYQHRVPG